MTMLMKEVAAETMEKESTLTTLAVLLISILKFKLGTLRRMEVEAEALIKNTTTKIITKSAKVTTMIIIKTIVETKRKAMDAEVIMIMSITTIMITLSAQATSTIMDTITDIIMIMHTEVVEDTTMIIITIMLTKITIIMNTDKEDVEAMTTTTIMTITTNTLNPTTQ